MIIAEELCIDLNKLKVEAAPLGEKYGRQSTGGSGAVRGRFEPLRKVGAIGRQILINAAAQTWNVPAEECYAENGFIIHKPSSKKLSYGELAAKAATLPVPADAPLKDPERF